jgi:hypothetical protein
MNTLVYVDRELAVAMAVQLIGLESQQSRKRGVGGAFNWIVQLNVADETASSVTVDVRELLPEDVMHRTYEALDPSVKFADVGQCVTCLVETGEKAIPPGHPISVAGTLTFPTIDLPAVFDPFDPPDIELRTFLVHGEKCFAGQLEGNGFRLPIYFPEVARMQVPFFHDEPVEITGVVRWSPPYSPKGSRASNRLIRAAAVWLR